MSSHGFHRFTQIPRVRCSPTEYAEFTEPPAEMSSHGFHRFTQILRVRCSPTEFGSVGMAGMPYPPTSVNIRAVCGRLFSARSFCAFRAFCGNIFSPTDFTDLHRCLECAVLQQNTEFGSVGMAGMPYPPTSVLICVICGRFFSARSFRVFRAFCGNIFSPTDFTDLHICTPWAGSVGMAGMPYPPNLCASVSSVGGSSLPEVLCIRCIPWELLHRLFCWCCRDCCIPWRNPRK